MDTPATPVADKYINRELSLLEFNRRVLAQANDPEMCLSWSACDFFVSHARTWTSFSKFALRH